MSAEIPNSQGDVVVCTEANMNVIVIGERTFAAAALEGIRSCHTIMKR